MWYNNLEYDAVRRTALRERGFDMDIRVNDELVMKKPHPCGGDRFTVLRVGMDFKLRCLGCGREVMVPRRKAEHNIRQVIRDGAPTDKDR